MKDTCSNLNYRLTALNFKPGSIIYHKPRNHFYYLVAPTKMKTRLAEVSTWVDAWIYIRAEKEGECGFSYNAFGSDTIFTRSVFDFDSDWSFIR
ncbi:MAG: hypothetical protein [Caudoviricetes sp.]|nr:MAG: hypothetical protein [Caudoviricetes sp.]